MPIRTGGGDKGVTDLLFHRRIQKDSHEIHALGDLDELNSYIGLVKTKTRQKSNKLILEKIQMAICKIATEIVVGPEKKKQHGLMLKKDDVYWVEGVTCELERKVKLKDCFYLPGENELSSFLDIARSVARRAERSIVALYKKETTQNENILVFLNCVSDILFIMARSARDKVRKRKITEKSKLVRKKKISQEK